VVKGQSSPAEQGTDKFITGVRRCLPRDRALCFPGFELGTDRIVHPDGVLALPIDGDQKCYDPQMRQAHPNSPARYPKERRYRRFNLQFPVSLSFPAAGRVHELFAVTKNVSIGGLLLKTGDPIPVQTQVSLRMDVRRPWSIHPVRLIGDGMVVRVENLGQRDGYAIAIECAQAITEMEEFFPAAS